MNAARIPAWSGRLVRSGGGVTDAHVNADDGQTDATQDAADAASDWALVERVSRGDHGAFETLYHRHRDWVVNLAWRFTSDHEMALDVMQEAFAYLARRPPVLRKEGKLTTFLYPVVKHRAIDARRRGTRAHGLEAAAASEARGDASELHASVRGAVDSLAEAQREVLLMRFVSGMSLAEIAEALGVPLGTVKSRLHAAVRAVGERMMGSG